MLKALALIGYTVFFLGFGVAAAWYYAGESVVAERGVMDNE